MRLTQKGTAGRELALELGTVVFEVLLGVGIYFLTLNPALGIIVTITFVSIAIIVYLYLKS